MERCLPRLWIELGDKRAMPGGSYPYVQMGRAAWVATWEVGLIAVTPLAVYTLRRPVVLIVLATGIRQPPFDPRTGNRAAARSRTHRA